MRENRQSGSEGGEPQTNAAFLPLSSAEVEGPGPIVRARRPTLRQEGPGARNDRGYPLRLDASSALIHGPM